MKRYPDLSCMGLILRIGLGLCLLSTRKGAKRLKPCFSLQWHGP